MAKSDDLAELRSFEGHTLAAASTTFYLLLGIK